MLGHLGIGLLTLNMLANLGDAANGSTLSAMVSGGVSDQKVAIVDALFLPTAEAVGGILLVLAFGSVGVRFLLPEPAGEPAVGR